ncbi:TetR/AcrR family transcriptional regulator [Agarilytica rhodophyticola]|uniref:TetR/AcrR family transcriptional regulator n=1 Tax=Agarilytica rhodophyticola TaxID=1737490 RepID=UPI000B34208F|nr:TetR/AcrR family transcriptional regulator [Agarilytica rhodophyticola]
MSNQVSATPAPKSMARGSATRTANMNKRRDYILSCAGHIIAKEGLDALTLNKLAAKADVTIPTIHNLIGKKSDIFQRLVDEMITKIEQALSGPENNGDPINAAETFIDNLMALFAADEALYKAAFVAGERINLFDHQSPHGIFARSLEVATHVCQEAIQRGDLQGSIEASVLARQLFDHQRLARHDWVHGYINLNTYRKQVLTSMFITLASDASKSLRVRLIEKIQQLNSIVDD